MNDKGLEYIRTYYKDYIELYIDKNVEKYLNIITSNNFNYEEALYVLDMRIDDEEKVKLLSSTSKPISVVGKTYSSFLIDYILNNNFDEHDEN